MKQSLAHSIRFRLPLIISLGILPPMLTAIWYASSRASHIIYEDAEANMSLKAAALANSISHWDEMNMLALQTMSRQPDMLSMEKDRQQIVLYETVHTYQHLFLAHTTNREGINIARSDNQTPKNYSDRPWFLGAMAGNSITRQALISRTTYEPALCTSTPIRKQPYKTYPSQILGVAAICTDLTELADQVAKVHLGETGYAFLVDALGQVLAHPIQEFSDALYDLSDYPPVAATMQGQNQDLHFTDKNNIDWISFGIPLSNGWSIIVQQQESEVFLPQHTYLRLSLVVAALAVVSVGALSWLIANQMLHPISYLTQAAAALSEGHLNRQVKIDSKDELGTLAKAFNSMTQQLQASFSALRKANEELEQRVEQRTSELEIVLSDLQQTQVQMLHSEKMSALGQMVAGVAHEINNPVSFIHGNLRHLESYAEGFTDLLQLYETRYPNPAIEIQEQAEDIDIDFVKKDINKILLSMKAGTERIREIVLSLRSFSRMDEADRKFVDIHDGLKSTLMVLSHRLQTQSDQPDIQIIRVFDELPLVECFAGQLNQVFMNILVNSIESLEAEKKACSKDQKIPKITLRTEALSTSVIISIVDNGPGIPPAIKDSIFNPFFTTKSVGQGTGMGLAISYQIITEKHNGKIECFSDEGVGTEFRIEVPMRISALTKK